MNTSTRHPGGGDSGPFVMHLERVCRLIEMGADFQCIEFNPYSDIPPMLGDTLTNVRLRIHEGGDVSVHTRKNTVNFNLLGLTLANYKKLWRVWQNGTPAEAQRKHTRWG